MRRFIITPSGYLIIGLWIGYFIGYLDFAK